MDFPPEMKRIYWRAWFDRPALMIGGTPREAAQTPEGREGLERIFEIYEREKDNTMANAVPPTRWAKWKLGYGPGSAEEFAEEEAIFNGPEKPTQRKEKHAARLNKRSHSIYIPQRCEVVGCEKRDGDVKACGRCHCAWYCSKGHQIQDYPRHKLDCKHLASYADSDLKRKEYNTQRELEKYPMRNDLFSTIGSPTKCMICWATADEVQLGYAPCCNIPMCDNEEDCLEAHQRSTKCYEHYKEKHDGPDWRNCDQCNTMEPTDVRPYATTNGFNVTPALETNLPQGSLLTMACQNASGCKKRLLPGHDSYSIVRSAAGEMGALCAECTDDRATG